MQVHRLQAHLLAPRGAGSPRGAGRSPRARGQSPRSPRSDYLATPRSPTYRRKSDADLDDESGGLSLLNKGIPSQAAALALGADAAGLKGEELAAQLQQQLATANATIGESIIEVRPARPPPDTNA